MTNSENSTVLSPSLVIVYRVPLYEIPNIGADEKIVFFFFLSESLYRGRSSPGSSWWSRRPEVFLTQCALSMTRSRGEGLVWVSSGDGGTRYTVSVIRRGLRSPLLPTRHLGGWTPPRRFGIPTRDVAPPPRGTPNPHLVRVPGAWSPMDLDGVVLSRPRCQGETRRDRRRAGD